MHKALRDNFKIIAVSMVTAMVTAGAPAIAAAVANFAKNADKVDGKHAVSSGANIDARKGALVATNKKGFLPNNIIKKAVDSQRLDGKDSRDFLGATAKAADSELLDGKDSNEFLGATAKAADSELIDGVNGSQLQRVCHDGALRASGFISSAGVLSDPFSCVGDGSLAVTRLSAGVYEVDTAGFSCIFICPDMRAVVTPVSNNPAFATASFDRVGESCDMFFCTGGERRLIVRTFNVSGTPTDFSSTFAIL